MSVFRIVGAAFAVGILGCPWAAAQTARDATRERRIEQALGTVAPAAVPAFRRGTTAMDAHDNGKAEVLFREVLLTSAPSKRPWTNNGDEPRTKSGKPSALDFRMRQPRRSSPPARRVSDGATRLQEVLADRVAARVYGPAAFEEGLRHVVRRSAEFSAAVNDEVQQAIQSRRALQNLYTLDTHPPSELDDAVAEQIARPTTEDDTHPGPADRFRLISGVRYQGAPPDTSPVWDLFAAPERITAEMTTAIQTRVRDAAAGV